MKRSNSRRRVTVAAAGLTFSAALMMGCGHARGERATDDADSAAVVDSANVYTTDSSTSLNPATPATTPSTAPSNRESTDAPRTSARTDNYEVAPVPSDRPAARVTTRSRTDADESRTTAEVTTDDTRSTASAEVRTENNPPASTDMPANDAPVTTTPSTTTPVTTTPSTTPSTTETPSTTPSTTAPSTTTPSTTPSTTTPSTTPSTTTPSTTTPTTTPSTTTPSTTPDATPNPANRDEAPVSAEVRTDDSRVSEPVARRPESPNASATPSAPVTSNAEAMPSAEANRASLAGTAAVTACFANGDKEGLEYPSARADADASVTTEAPEAAKPADSTAAHDQAMAPAAQPEVAAVPADRPADNAMSDRPAEAAEPTGRIVPCMKSGDKAGRAAGAFMNDAQISHAALIANTIDSAVSVAAVRRATNPAVRDYAQMMIRDHTEANQKASALLERLHMSPAQNELSDEMLSEVGVLTAGMNTPASTSAGAALTDRNAANATSSSTLTAGRNPEAAVGVTATTSATTTTDRDTLHLNNRFVAAANMQPWSTLLSGLGDSINAEAATPAARTAPSASVTATTTTTTTPSASASVTAPATTETTSASDFDKKYIDYQVNFHQAVLDNLDARLIPWSSPDLRSLLEEQRPKVAAHLERARELQRQLNSNATNDR